MTKLKGLVRGVGVNDAEYLVSTRDEDGRRITCHFYNTWVGMINRCYSPKVLLRQPTYAGCSVAPEWLSFTAFKSWMEAQDWKGNVLDKDILVEGNKVYGPDTCAFVSHKTNSFILDSRASRGGLPVGVYWRDRRSNFSAQCGNPFTGKSESLGSYSCANQAHEAWRNRKHELACIFAEQQTDPRVANALRTRYMEANKV